MSQNTSENKNLNEERLVPRRSHTDGNSTLPTNDSSAQELYIGRTCDIITPLPRTFSQLDEDLDSLLENNRNWADAITRQSPNFFKNMAKEQNPKILWIGCSDSRVPAETVVQLGPGEIFVHRNIANQFNHTDLNCLSVLQYAVDHLGVEHVIVCGHYGCGGVGASMNHHQHGLVDSWLLGIKDVYRHNRANIDSLPEDKRADRLVELNVTRQVTNIASTSIVQNAWSKGRRVEVHGWVYEMDSGILKKVGDGIGQPEEFPDPVYKFHYDSESVACSQGQD